MAKTSASFPSLRLSALGTLNAGLSDSKADRHQFIVSQCAVIVALALCGAPPRGVGNPADHARLPDVFKAAKLDNYADACASVRQTLKGAMRSVPAWDEACSMGETIAETAFATLAPKVRTQEQQDASAAKKAAKKVETEKQAKLDAKAEKQARAEDLAHEYTRGQQSAVISGAMVADAIRAGAFTAADLALIGAALTVRTAKRATAPADVQDVPAREVLSLPAVTA